MVKHMDMTVAPPPPNSWNMPDIQTMRRGKIRGRAPKRVSNWHLPRGSPKKTRIHTHYRKPDLTKDASDECQHQDLAASDAVGEGAIRDRDDEA